jgi:AcrR family transcriptional regulator
MKKKDEIFQQASQMFQEKGYLATSMRELAANVGLEPSSLYSHLSSKEEILRKICFETADQFMDGMKQVLKSNEPTIDKLRSLISLHIRIAIQNKTAVTVFNDEWRNLSEPHLSDFLALRKEYEEGFLRVIRAGIHEKILKLHDPNVLMNVIVNSVNWLHYWHNDNKNIGIASLERQFHSILLSGILSIR